MGGRGGKGEVDWDCLGRFGGEFMLKEGKRGEKGDLAAEGLILPPF